MGFHAYFSKPEYQSALIMELGDASLIDERLVTSPHLMQAAFALDIWPDCERIPFVSIREAIKQLKARSLRWYYYGSQHFRRGHLIAEGLKIIKPTEIAFQQPNFSPFAVYTLLSANELLVCKRPWKKWPMGEINFVENKIDPPGRAYLKLWEALMLMNAFPHKNEVCLDLGASPGSWSWVLAQCGAQVIAVDKASLAPHIADYPNIQFEATSAFALTPSQYEKIDWLCADIICYPLRALSLVHKWIDSGIAKHIICTIKLQGENNWEAIKAFQAIPEGMVTHLFHNKHELCFLWPMDAV